LKNFKKNNFLNFSKFSKFEWFESFTVWKFEKNWKFKKFWKSKILKKIKNDNVNNNEIKSNIDTMIK